MSKPPLIKTVSTYECCCVDDAGAPAAECQNCWEWQRFDFVQTMDGWVKANPTAWFGLSNIYVEMPDGSFDKDSGSAKLRDADDLLDFLIIASDDCSLDYKEPVGDEWSFSQRIPSNPSATVSKAFYSSDRSQ